MTYLPSVTRGASGPLARAFAPGPKLLLADEPTGNLDGDTGGAIIELLFSIHEARDTTLVLITHDPELAGRCGRIARMKDGRIDGIAPGAALGGA